MGMWLQVLSGVDQWKTYKIEHHPEANRLQINSGAHSIVATDTCVVFGNKFSALYPNQIDAKYWRVRIPVQNAYDGYFQIGTIIAGPAFKPGSVPLEWTMQDQDRINVESFTADNGVTWSYQKGKVGRIISGRFVGDVNRQRDSFRAMVRGLCQYAVKPLAFVMDEGNVDTALLGNITDGLSLDSEGWYKDDANKWRLAGDMGITVTEVI